MNKLTAKNTNMYALYAAAFVTLWIGLAFFVFQQVTFETNDDNAMARIIYGMTSTDYDPHLVYINVILGYFMKGLLLLFPAVPWYPVLQCLVIAASFFVLSYLIFARFNISKGLFPVLLLVFFFGAEYCLKLQFSKTAGIATVAGVLLLFDSVKQDQDKPYWKWIVGGLLALVGSLYRFNSFGLVLIPMLGIGILMLEKPFRNRDLKRMFCICLPFIIVFSACLVCRFYNTWEYKRTETWVFYKQFNSLRAQLLDYGFPDYYENIDLYEELEISSEDLQMFKQWDFADPEVFTIDAMKQLVKAKVRDPFEWSICQQNLHEFFFDYHYSIAVLIALAVATITNRLKQWALVMYAVLSVIAAQIYLYASGRFGLNRVDATLAISLFAVLVLYCWGKWQYPVKVTPILTAALILIAPYDQFREKPEEQDPVPLYELLYSDQESMYFRTMNTSTTTIPTCFEMYPVGYQKNYSALGGWATYSAPYMEKMKHFGITNPFRDMVDNPNVFLISGGDVESRVNYIRRHYAPDAAARRVKVTEDKYTIYRITTLAGPDLDASKAIAANGLDDVNYSLSAQTSNGSTTFSGYCYKDGENSFASNIYLSLADEYGIEQTYYVTQKYSESFGDLMNGQYGSFTTVKHSLNPNHYVRLYLEIEDELYYFDMGTLAQLESTTVLNPND